MSKVSNPKRSSTRRGRDEFSLQTKRILSERAGQRCANPDCHRCTSGPSDSGSEDSTISGKASHITAAANGGPRYDDSLSSAERRSPSNGIWLCSLCADRVDKSENSAMFPVALLKVWKANNESVAGTDHGTAEARRRLPIRSINIHHAFGAIDVNFRLGYVTAISGTRKMNRSVSDILLGLTSEAERLHLCNGWPLGKVIVEKSTGEVITLFSEENVPKVSINNAHTPLMTTGFQVVDVPPRVNQSHRNPLCNADDDKGGCLQKLSALFQISLFELRDCFKGTPQDTSLFGYTYKLGESDLEVSTDGDRLRFPYYSLSSGEMSRVHIDLSFRIAHYKSFYLPVVFLLNQENMYTLDTAGWDTIMRTIFRRRPPFQVIAEFFRPPKGDSFPEVLCYKANGEDSKVNGFSLCSWNDL